MNNPELEPAVTETQAKDARDIMQAQKDLKAHLKSLSKNELIQTVIHIAQALAVQIETTKALNANLKLMLNQNENKEQVNEEVSVTSTVSPE